MKKYYFLLLMIIFGTVVDVSAQTTAESCGTSEAQVSYWKANPSAKKEHEAFNQFTRTFTENYKQTLGRNAGTLSYTIPVVVHVYGSQQNGKPVTYEIVKKAIEEANKDFNGQNSDWATVSSRWSPIKEKLNIQFKLATKDPNGQTTTGVIFHEVASGMGNYNSPFVRRDAWNNYKYMNIYITGDLYGDGKTNNSGVAWYPNTTMSNQNIARVVYNGQYLFGNTNSEFASTLTHEFGHYLNLIHTHENGCLGTDEVDDTPQDTRDNGGQCSETLDCGHEINTENYMGYNGSSGCYKMFTKGQVARMIAALEHPTRKPLWQTQNLVDTGTAGVLISNKQVIAEDATHNDGSFSEEVIVTLNNISLTKSSGTLQETTDYTKTLPAGMDAVVTVNNAKELKITFTGKAASHNKEHSAIGGITILNSVITENVSDATLGMKFNFYDPFNVFYVDIDDKAVNGLQTWNFFRINEGDDNRFGAWVNNGNLRLETYEKPLVTEGSTRNIALLSGGVELNSSSNWKKGGANPNQHDLRTSTYTKWDGKTGYIGFQITIHGAPCYGWFKVEVHSSGTSYKILDYAYSNKPYEPIRTGQKVLSTSDIVLEKEIALYPNPAKNIVTLKNNGNHLIDAVRVYDIQGRVVVQRTALSETKEITLSLEGMAAGSYFVEIKAKGNIRAVKKLIKH